MNVLRQCTRRLALAALSALVLAACQEDLNSGAACPSLCPEQQLGIKDTVFVAQAALDTVATVPGFPVLGNESQLLVADYVQHGNHLKSVAVFRFDTLQRLFFPADTTQPPIPFTSVELPTFSFAVLAAPVGKDTVFVKDSVTFELFDVDANVPDLDTAAVRARFSGAPIATLTVKKDSVAGTKVMALDTAWVGQHVRTGQRIRLGLMATSPQGFQVRIASSEGASLLGATTPNISYIGHVAPPDSSKLSVRVLPVSRSAVGPRFPGLADYQMILAGSLTPPPGMFQVGGLPASRAYLHFDLPSALIDSSTTIVRANLELTQAADSDFFSSDTLDVNPRVVLAGPELTDISKIVAITADPTTLSVRPINGNPALARLDTIPLVGSSSGRNVIAFWRAQGRHTLRALVLQSAAEGLDPRRYLFYSTAAIVPDSLRPRLRVTYIPRSGFGLP